MSSIEIPNSSPAPEEPIAVAGQAPDAEGNPFVNVKPKEEDAPGNPYTGKPTPAPKENNFQAVADMVYAQMIAAAEKEAAKPLNNSSLTTPALGKELEKMELPVEQAASINPDGLPQPKYADDLMDAMIAGWQLSTTGLGFREQLPDTYLKDDASASMQFVSGLAQMGGDIPMMVAGLMAGGVSGLAGGPAAEVTVPLGAAAGASAFPAMYRRYLMESYEQKTARDFRTFWARTNGVLWEGIKHGTIGAATAGAGAVVGKVAPKVLPKFLSQAKFGGGVATATTMARLTTEVATMTTLGAALEGHMPKAQDFTNAALFVGFMHGTTQVVTGGTHKVAGKLRKVFAETGIRPEQVLDDAQKNPVILQELLSDDGEMPTLYKDEARMQNIPKPPPLPGESKVTPIKEAMKPLEGMDESGSSPKARMVIREGERGSVSGKDAPDPQKVDRYGKEFTEGEKAILAKVTDGKVPDNLTFREKLSVGYDEVYTQAVEEYLPLRKLVDELSGGRQLSPLENPVTMFVNAQSAGIALKYLETGVEDFVTKKRITRGLKEVMEPFKKDVRRLEAYRIAKQAIDMDAQGKATGIDLDHAREVVKAGAKEFESAHKELVDIDHAAVLAFGEAGGLSRKQVQYIFGAGENYVPLHRLVEDAPKGWGVSIGSKPVKFRKGSERDIIEPLQSTIKNVVQLSVLTEKMRTVESLAKLAIEEGGENGVEGLFWRVKDKVEKVAINKELKEFADAHGLELTDDSAEVFFAFRPQARQLGPLDVARMVDGRTEIWRAATPEIAKLLRGGDRASVAMYAKIAQPFTRALVTGATTTLEFVARNPVVDALTAWLTEGAVPVYTQMRGLRAYFKRGGEGEKVWDTYLSGGGSMKSVKEVEKFAEQYKHTKGNSYFQDSVNSAWNVVKSPWDALVFLRDLSEMSTRLGVTEKVLNELTGNGTREITPNIIYEAGGRTRAATIDFLRTGAKVRAANQAISFLSVNIQALNVGFGAFAKDAKNIKGVIKGEMDPSVLKKGAFARTAPITAMTVMNWWANKDDERVKALKRWEKDHFWIFATDNWVPAEDEDEVHFMPSYLKRPGSGFQGLEVNKGTLIKVKKPEVLIPFTSLPERALEAFFTENPRAWKDFDETIMQTLIPSLMPTVALPVVEQMANHVFFTGHRMIPEHLMGVAPEFRYNDYTSETAKKLGEMTSWLGRTTDTGMASSPIVIENYLRAWTGGVGQYALQLADAALIESGVVDRPAKPEKKFSEWPLVRAYVAKFPMANSQHTDDFFDRYDKVQENVATLNLLAKRMGAEKQYEDFLGRLQENDVVRLDGYKKAIGDAKEYMQMIDLNPDMTPKEKRQLQEGQLYFILGISKEGIDLLDELDKEVATMKKEMKGKETR